MKARAVRFAPSGRHAQSNQVLKKKFGCGLRLARGMHYRGRRKKNSEVPEEGFHGNHQEVTDGQQFRCNVRLGKGHQLP
jgi:hypothetical protein